MVFDLILLMIDLNADFVKSKLSRLMVSLTFFCVIEIVQCILFTVMLLRAIVFRDSSNNNQKEYDLCFMTFSAVAVTPRT